MPAIELYDGPAFRIVRRYFAESNGKSSLDVLVLSAKYGFLPAHKKIWPYEMRMSKARAQANNARYQSQLRAFMRGRSYGRIFVNLGKDYLGGAANLSSTVASDTQVTFATGRIGQRLSQMKNWLAMLQVKQAASSR